MSDYITNIFNERVTLLEEDAYAMDDSDIITEATTILKKDLRNMEIYKIDFKKLEDHQVRPGLIIRIPGQEPLVMIIGSTKPDGKWKKYKANKFLKDWKIEGLKKPSFAYTDAIVKVDSNTIIKHKLGVISKTDYDKIVLPIYDNLMNAVMGQLISGKTVSADQAIKGVYKNVNTQEAEESYLAALNQMEIHKGDFRSLEKLNFVYAPRRGSDTKIPNSILTRRGKKYRVRVETLIYNSDGKILAAKRSKPTNMNCMYKLPGGSLEPNKDIKQQAISECQEEVRVNVSNIAISDFWYINEFDESTKAEKETEFQDKYGIVYDGFITIVCVAKYDSAYEGFIEETDRVDWIKDVNFYTPDELGMADVHRMALKEFGIIKRGYMDSVLEQVLIHK